MAKLSSGVLVYRIHLERIEVLLVHPGGPFWRKRDAGAWSIPKGEHSEEELPEAAARREFAEETGWTLTGPLVPLGEVRQKGGKLVTAFTMEGDFPAAELKSNEFQMEWPPRSGQLQSFPEVDRAQWFTIAEAHEKLLEAQHPFLDRLEALIVPSVPSRSEEH